MDAPRALAKGGGHAVGARVAAADHDDVEVAGADVGVGGITVEKGARLRREVLNGEMDAGEVGAGHAQPARVGGTRRHDHGVEVGEKAGGDRVVTGVDAAANLDAALAHEVEPASDHVLR